VVYLSVPQGQNSKSKRLSVSNSCPLVAQHSNFPPINRLTCGAIFDALDELLRADEYVRHRRHVPARSSWWPHAPPVEATRERLKGSCAGALQRLHEREKTCGESVGARNQRLPPSESV
jgi:hypothetical protein